jgi:hypothetical protein
MPQQNTFSNGVVMIGWDPALLANQPPVYVKEFYRNSKVRLRSLIANKAFSKHWAVWQCKGVS